MIYRHSTAHLLAAAVTALFPEVQCGIGPPTDEGFFYDFVVPRPFVPEDLDAIEKKMRELAQADFRFERQMWPREEAKRFFGARGEPLKVQLIDEKTEGQSEVSVLHHQGPRDLRGLLRRPARAVERPAQGLQAADDVERLLEGRRAQPADAAASTARRSSPRRSWPTISSGSKKPSCATTARSARTRSCSCSTPGRRAPPSGCRRARCSTTRSRHYMRERAGAGRLHRGEGADRLQQGAVGDVRPLVALPPEHVSGGVRGRADGPQGHELPRPHADVRAARSAATRTCPSATTSRRRSTGTRRRACCPGLTRVRQFAQDDGHCFVTPEQIGERGGARPPAGPAGLP